MLCRVAIIFCRSENQRTQIVHDQFSVRLRQRRFLESSPASLLELAKPESTIACMTDPESVDLTDGISCPSDSKDDFVRITDAGNTFK